MTNLSLGGAFQSTASLASLTSLNKIGGGASATSQTSAVSLYPQATPDTVNSAVGQYVNTPVILIKTRGDDAMQQVTTRVVSSPSSGCSNGALAQTISTVGTLVGAAGEVWEGDPEHTSTALGEAGRYTGEGLCEVGTAVGQAVNALFHPDENNPPVGDGDGGSCTDPGPTGGQSRGTTGGYSADPQGPGGGFSSPGSYIDPETGEQITNQDGKTIAGDPNADKGTYIGEVDDPNFVSAGDSSASSSNASSPEATDTAPPEPAQADPAPTPTPDGSLPPDDASGTSSGPAGPRSDFMPADDSVGGVTPRSDGASLASLTTPSAAGLQLIALSRTQLA